MPNLSPNNGNKLEAQGTLCKENFMEHNNSPKTLLVMCIGVKLAGRNEVLQDPGNVEPHKSQAGKKKTVQETPN